MSKKPRDVFNEVLELISDRERWTQGVAARNAEGKEVAYDSPEATCWCLVGAIAKADPDFLAIGSPGQVVDNALKERFVSRSLAGFNDHSGHLEVLAHLRAVGVAKGWLTAENKGSDATLQVSSNSASAPTSE